MFFAPHKTRQRVRRLPLTRAEQIQLFVARTFQAVLAGELLAGLISFNWWVAFITSMALLASFLPAILDHNTRLHTPAGFQLVITLFIFATFLGEAAEFYWRFWWWDKTLHTVSGILLGLIGFLMLITLFDRNRLRLNPVLLSMFALAFAMGVGTVWEFFEYAVDKTFSWNMQRASLSDTSGLDDTMLDMIFNAVGASAAIAVAHMQLSRRRGRKWLKDLAAQFVDEPPPPKPARQRGYGVGAVGTKAARDDI